MRAYDYTRATSTAHALRAGAPESRYLAGGTTLVDLMKLEVETPQQVVDINRLPLRGISTSEDGLRIGALEKMSAVADSPVVRHHYPVIAEALDLSASRQLRNMATIGGNLLQRTRCGYFRDVSTACNKREPGSGCSALDGVNRAHAILGVSDSCIATHASDLAVALVALDAQVHLLGRDGERTVALGEFYTLPGDSPEVENGLTAGELITAVTVPSLRWARTSHYVKVRDRASYEFALSSVAVAVRWDGNRIGAVRLAAGGVATVPWRLTQVERRLVGMRAGEDGYRRAARAAALDAQPRRHNAFKPALLRNTVVRALLELEASR